MGWMCASPEAPLQGELSAQLTEGSTSKMGTGAKRLRGRTSPLASSPAPLNKQLHMATAGRRGRRPLRGGGKPTFQQPYDAAAYGSAMAHRGRCALRGWVRVPRKGGRGRPPLQAPHSAEKPPGIVTGRLTLSNCQREGSLCQRRHAAGVRRRWRCRYLLCWGSYLLCLRRYLRSGRRGSGGAYCRGRAL